MATNFLRRKCVNFSLKIPRLLLQDEKSHFSFTSITVCDTNVLLQYEFMQARRRKKGPDSLWCSTIILKKKIQQWLSSQISLLCREHTTAMHHPQLSNTAAEEKLSQWGKIHHSILHGFIRGQRTGIALNITGFGASIRKRNLQSSVLQMSQPSRRSVLKN